METKLFGKYLSNILDTSVRMIHVKFCYQLNRNVSTMLRPPKKHETGMNFEILGYKIKQVLINTVKSCQYSCNSYQKMLSLGNGLLIYSKSGVSLYLNLKYSKPQLKCHILKYLQHLK